MAKATQPKVQPNDSHLVVPDILKLNRILAHRRLWPLLVVAVTAMIYILSRTAVPAVIWPTTANPAQVTDPN